MNRSGPSKAEAAAQYWRRMQEWQRRVEDRERRGPIWRREQEEWHRAFDRRQMRNDEAQVRNRARKQGLGLRKSRRRDPNAPDFGTYHLVDLTNDEPVTALRCTLDEVRTYLSEHARTPESRARYKAWQAQRPRDPKLLEILAQIDAAVQKKRAEEAGLGDESPDGADDPSGRSGTTLPAHDDLAERRRRSRRSIPGPTYW